MNKQKAQERINQMKIEMAELERIIKEEDVIYVPDEIEFEDIANGYLFGLKFDGNGSIYYDVYDKRFGVGAFDEIEEVRCKLTPIKYEDIKVGNWSCVIHKSANNCFGYKDNYYLSVGKGLFKVVNNDADISTVRFTDCEGKYNFWKVEKV